MEQNNPTSITKSQDFTKEERKNDNIHECQFCQKVFAHNSSLIKHIRIHTGDKPYLCSFPDCNHKFSQVSNLIRHKRIHNGIKPFSCHFCQKTFTSSSNLKQHVSIHQNQFNRSKFVCIINDCKKSYLYICTLKKHLQSAHKRENDEISEEFKEEKNFITIYKKLISEPKKFPFIVIKNSSNNSSYIQELSTSLSSVSANPFEKFSQSVNYFNFNNQSSPKDFSTQQNDVNNFKDELKNCFAENMHKLKQYLDYFTKSFVSQNYERRELNNFESYIQMLSQYSNIMPLANLKVLPFHGINNTISQEHMYNFRNMMLLNYMKSIFPLK